MLLFLILQALDIVTTLLVFHRGGYEANPIVRMFLHAGPVAGLILAKLFVVGIVFAARRHHRAVALANLAYAAIVCWNVTLYTFG